MKIAIVNGLSKKLRNINQGLYSFCAQLINRQMYRRSSKSQILVPIANQLNSRKVCFFAHYSMDSQVDESTFAYLRELKNCGFSLIFCSTSKAIHPQYLERLRDLCDGLILRENIGLDFGSWATCHQYLTNAHSNYLDDLDLLLLANDSVIGPTKPLTPIFERMNDDPCEVWGLTDSFEIKYHLQSYFLVLKSKALRTTFIKKFFEGIRYYKNKNTIIQAYEVGLSQMLISSGFQLKAAFPYAEILQRRGEMKGVHCNPVLFYSSVLSEQLDFPFVKKSLIKKTEVSID